MRLYTDGKLVTAAAGAGELERALAGFERTAYLNIELRRSPLAHLRANRDEPGSCMLEISLFGNVFGMRILQKDIGQVRAAFQEFLRGYSPRLPWEKLDLTQGPEVASLVIGDPYRDDCPLCRMLG